MNYVNHPYDIRFRADLNEIRPGLADDLSSAEQLQEGDADRLITLVLERACQCQNARNILLGREAIVELPRGWLLERFDQVARQQLNLDSDDWEYVSLEVSEMLDPALLARWIQHGLTSQDAGIKEAADDWSRAMSPGAAGV